MVGDGEAETGALAASWHSNKFINPARDGAVHQALAQILHIQRMARAQPLLQTNSQPLPLPRWPMIVLRTPKGWTGPKQVDGLPTEGHWRSHQVPIANVSTPAHLQTLDDWLRSYRPQELFDADGALRPELAALAPSGARRMGANVHSNGGAFLQGLLLPDLDPHAVAVPEPGASHAEATRVLGHWLREVMQRNLAAANFRLFGPDETASNRLDAVYAVTGKVWLAEVRPADTDLSADGRVMEVLSEHAAVARHAATTQRHKAYICEHGDDLPEILQWRWAPNRRN